MVLPLLIAGAFGWKPGDIITDVKNQTTTNIKASIEKLAILALIAVVIIIIILALVWFFFIKGPADKMLMMVMLR